MSIGRLDHVGIVARDGEQVVAFYRDLLGFALTGTREAPALQLKFFDLQAQGTHLEILQPLGGTATSEGIKHLAFLSDDIAADLQRLQEQGAKLVHEQVQQHEHVSFFFVRGAAGELIEIMQYGT